MLLFDAPLAPLVAQLAPRLRSVRAFVVLTDRGHMPQVGARAARGSRQVLRCSHTLRRTRVLQLCSKGARLCCCCSASMSLPAHISPNVPAWEGLCECRAR